MLPKSLQENGNPVGEKVSSFECSENTKVCRQPGEGVII